MNKKNSFLFKSISALLLISLLYYYFSNSKNIKSLPSNFIIKSIDLASSYALDEKKADSLYINKIIKVYGNVKEISYLNNRNTVILLGSSPTSSVICDLNKNELNKLNQLKTNQTVYIKGICKGYLNDVILLNCYIDTIKNDE
ncbi:tRNA_anti-like [Tenacibaculum sp. MAR_2009_124]|uniref:OB-fold protein n=1 Tax=Tenacibaculum sp. MAR_2009_124 TaxID=1250059 RepID=UPI0008974979|nr:hypothetical protein [Tenacibaculum sp. MAR_2009_124]SEC30965.1 tRNA_anti-like [Tenacibaculum sp. MAR_2009_124]